MPRTLVPEPELIAVLVTTATDVRHAEPAESQLDATLGRCTLTLFISLACTVSYGACEQPGRERHQHFCTAAVHVVFQLLPLSRQASVGELH